MPSTSNVLKTALPAFALLLAACAAPPPPPGPDFSVVRFSHDNPDEIVGQKLDGKNTEDGKSFKVKAGSHDLVVVVQRQDTNGKMQYCFATLQYANFKDDEVYNIHEDRLGRKVFLQLRRHTEVLATNDGPLNCSPGS